VKNLTPQLVNAGTIKMTYPENRAAEENFENLRKQYAAGVQSIRYGEQYAAGVQSIRYG
jgi:vinculin